MTKIYDFYNISNNTFCIDNNIKLEWEIEVLTEFKSYQYIKNLKDRSLQLSYIAYPWALLIDYYHNKFKNKFTTFFNFLDELNLIEQLKDKRDYSITVIQSYHFKKYLSDFKRLGIKYIFSPHITKKDFLDIFYKYDIIIYPYYIYPSIKSEIKNRIDKDILYNFIGNVNYSLEHPTFVRNNIINMKHHSNSVVKKLEEWHFNKSIYQNQLNIIKSETNSDAIISQKEERESEYRKVMGSSLFSICPLGIGPNSIRLWESLTYNTIPVSISDNLWLPFYIDVNWQDIIIDIKEDNYMDVLNLNKITTEKIQQYQENIEKFSKLYLENSNFGSIIERVFKPKKEFNLLLPWYNHPDKNSLRYKEIHQCLEINLKNDQLKSIIFFYEVNKVDELYFDDYQHPKIKIVPVITSKKRDITFNRLVRYANTHLLNEVCIISNNDIYYDNTLNEIFKLDFYKNNYFISLTRKNHDEYLDNNNKIWKPHSGSQDSWMFVSPLKLMDCEINLGWIQCDNIISEKYDSLGYNVINPHFSINAWHLHKYNNTNVLLEKFNYNYKYKMKRIPLKSINDILEDPIKPFIYQELNDKKENKIDIDKLSNLKKKWLKKIYLEPSCH